MITFKQFMESSLEELPFVLAFMKELGITKKQATEVLRWFKDDIDWKDVDEDINLVIHKRWPYPQTLKHPGMSYSDFVMDEISKNIRAKYKLDTRELI